MESPQIVWTRIELRLLMGAERALEALYSVRAYLRPALMSLMAGFAIGLVLAWL